MRHLFVYLGACLLLVVICLCTLGLPPRIIRKLETRLSSDHYALEVRSAVVHPLLGVVLRDVHVYPRGVIGSAVCDVERLEVRLNWMRLFGDDVPVRAVSAMQGTIRPESFRKRVDGESIKWREADFDINFTRVEMSGVMIDHLKGRASCREDEVEIHFRDVSVSRETYKGELEGSIVCGSMGEQRVELDAVCDFNVFLPFVDSRKMVTTGTIIRSLESPETLPTWHLLVERGAGLQPDYAVEAKFRMEDLVYRGVPLLRCDMRCRMQGGPTNLVSHFDRMLFVRDEGVFRGDMTVEMGATHKALTYDIRSSIHPEALAQMIGKMTNVVSQFRYEPPYEVASKGAVDFWDWGNTEISGNAMFGAVKRKVLKLDQCRFDFRMYGPTTNVDNVRGQWCGGQAEGDYMYVQGNDTGFKSQSELTFRVRDADFKTVSQSVFQRYEKQQTGTLSGSVQFTGTPGEAFAESLVGNGSVRIKDARLFLMPVFGGFTEKLVSAVPGLDLLLRPSDAKSKFTIGNGALRTKELLIDGRVLSLRADGKYWFDGRLAFDVELKFLKSNTFAADIIRLAMYPLSKLFTLRLSGRRQDAKWETVNF